MKKLFFVITYCLLFSTDYGQGEFKRVDVTNQQLNKINSGKIFKRPPGDVYEDYYTNDDDFGAVKVIDTPKLRRIIPFEKKEELTATNGRRPVLTKYQPPLKTFYPNQGPPDLMIAAGHKYLIISDAASFSFYDKNGYVLPLKTGGINVNWSATEFFQALIDSANKNNFGFLQNAPDNIVDWTVCGHGDSAKNKILSAAYDVRTIYEPESKRFIICAALRNAVWLKSGNSTCTKYAVRIFAYAVSKTEDPRDGFMMWYWTKNNYRDWPRISADKDVLIQAHAGTNKKSGTPSIYVISMQDLLAGVSSARWFTYNEGEDGTPASVAPVAKFKTGTAVTPFDGYEMFLNGEGDNAVLYYFKKSIDMWTFKPPLKTTDIDLNNDVKLDWLDRPVFRNGSIYFSSIVMVEDNDDNVHPDIYGYDVCRLPIKKVGSNLVFDENSPLNLEAPIRPVGTTDHSWLSLEMPALAVDDRGTICSAFGRLGKSGSSYHYPEARYFLYYQHEIQHRQSQVIHAGEAALKLATYQPLGWTDPHVTLDGYYSDYGNDTQKSAKLDYATVTPDPAQRFVFWIAHAYSSSSADGYKMVVSKVSAY